MRVSRMAQQERRTSGGLSAASALLPAAGQDSRNTHSHVLGRERDGLVPAFRPVQDDRSRLGPLADGADEAGAHGRALHVAAAR